ncbi:MAG: 4'-phosphopantetheinyl transferase superfamily protein [Gammaproteobacteria bacterium]|nr:4'-phosphopantetheinyl transferase superfamily protein [Gammaproteobacteria bacterium]
MTHWLKPNPSPQLNTGSVDIWLFQLNIAEPRIKQLYPLLSAEEKDRSERLINFIHRKRMIAAHGFMRSVLSLYLQRPPESLEFIRANRGKPSLIQLTNEADIQFNLSHSHNLAILAVADSQALGIDIEFMDRKHEWKKIIHRFFSNTEQAAIFKLPEAQQELAFYQVWTRKEAHMKVTGQGLHLGPGQFTVSVPPEAAAFIENHKQPDDRQWYMQDLSLPDMFDQYRSCLSSDRPITQLSQYLFS